jgi:hypothetical protein
MFLNPHDMQSFCVSGHGKKNWVSKTWIAMAFMA